MSVKMDMYQYGGVMRLEAFKECWKRVQYLIDNSGSLDMVTRNQRDKIINWLYNEVFEHKLLAVKNKMTWDQSAVG